jgi:hypothetical protein
MNIKWLAREGSQLVTNCNWLKLKAADDKNYLPKPKEGNA